LSLIKEKVSECIVAFDPSYISKSGKKTYGLGCYWSGCAGRAKRGLEICGFAAVDIALNTAFHLTAIQPPKSKDFNLLHYYCQIIKENYLYFKELTSYCRIKDELSVVILSAAKRNRRISDPSTTLRMTWKGLVPLFHP